MFRKPLIRAFGMVGGYLLCLWSIRLIFLTVVAYTLVRSGDTNTSSGLQRIGDVVRANQVLTYGCSAMLFVLILQILQPLTHTHFKQVFNFSELRKCFPSNALNGAIMTVVMIVGTMIGGHMSYLGVYMRFDEVVISLVSAGIFCACLFSLAIVEEYILRQVIETKLSESWGPVGVAAISSAVFLVMRFVQFDLGWIQVINLVLLNLTLSMIARTERSYMSSASFLAAFTLLTHVFFGLPFMGEDMPGFILLRGASEESLGSLLSGGASGPEAGIVMSVLLIIYLYLPQIRSKKIEV